MPRRRPDRAGSSIPSTAPRTMLTGCRFSARRWPSRSTAPQSGRPRDRHRRPTVHIARRPHSGVERPHPRFDARRNPRLSRKSPIADAMISRADTIGRISRFRPYSVNFCGTSSATAIDNMSRLLSFVPAALIIGVLVPAPAAAQQSFNIFLGGFVPRGLDGRANDDVLLRESVNGGCTPACPLATLNRNTGIDVNEFNGFTIGGEWLVGFGNNFEGGLGLGFYTRTVPTTYADLV